MGRIKEPKPAKLFMSLIVKEEGILKEAMEALEATFDRIDFVSERLPFNFTDYYSQEMGTPLFRHFITFEHLLSVSLLPQIKQTTNQIENKYTTHDGHRQINIDPGYICMEHVILATTKAYGHRPYLRNGIYADLTLIYRNKSFQPLDWTYPDYAQDRIIQLFNRIRKEYSENLKERERQPC